MGWEEIDRGKKKVNDDAPDVVVELHYLYTDHISEEAESPAHVTNYDSCPTWS